MAEYIEREAAIESFRKNLNGGYVLTNDAQTTHILQSIPAADVRLVIKGHWFVKHDNYGDGYTIDHWLCCSICGFAALYARMSDFELATKYCPNCGAEMR